MLSAQSRAALESQRMEVLIEVERLENELQAVDREQAQLNKEIKILEESGSFSDIDPEPVEAEPQVRAVIDSEDFTEKEDGAQYDDYKILQALHQELLNQQASQLQQGGYDIDPDALGAKMILARQEKQLEQALATVSQVETHHAGDKLNEEEFSKSEIPLSAAIEEPVLEVQQSQAQREALSGLLSQTADLDNDSQIIRTKISQLTSKLEDLNNKIEYAISGGKKTVNIATLDGVREEAIIAPAIIASTAVASRPTSSSFSGRKGFFSWPMQDAIIVSRYGQQQHKSIPSIKVNNKGINFRSANSAVTSIHEGVVEKISRIENLHTIIIKHDGNYYTVYSGLLNAAVLIGASVNEGTYLGHAAGNEMHFELWEGESNMNPSQWLKNN